jgi:hypothetical protein
MKSVMACGHSAQGHTSDGKPVCVICAPIPAAYVKVERADLTGRKARCSDCGREVDSNYDLPFFEFRPTLATDSYYSGCYGWN